MCTNCEKKLNRELNEDVSDVVMDFENLHIVSVLADWHTLHGSCRTQEKQA
jgi:hypothetical protein